MVEHDNMESVLEVPAHKKASKEGFLTKFSPTAVYFMGFATSIMIMFVVGFFVLLGVVVKDKVWAKDTNAAAVAAAPTPSAPTAPGEPAPANIVLKATTDQDHVRGNRKAAVSIVEFSDTECPFCKRFHPTIKEVAASYGDKVNWVYKYFPLDQLHPHSRKEAEAVECASEIAGNDGFWKFLDRIYEVTPSNDGLDPARLPQIAKDVGLDVKKFADCTKSGKYAPKIEAQYQEALAAGGQGTPYSVIVKGDTKIPLSGAMSATEMKSIIDSLLK